MLIFIGLAALSQEKLKLTGNFTSTSASESSKLLT